MQKDLTTILKNLPETPGCYQFYNKEGIIIYIGKAKNLKKRVTSYFSKEQENLKTRILVKRIYNIKYIVVNSESDALLLENNLIKKHKPKYNILLKDGKTYPSIAVTQEDFPQIFKTRKRNLKNCIYFGPYSNSFTIQTLLELIQKIYKPRSCKYHLTEKDISIHKYKPCLDYHIKKCGAPCIGKQSLFDYQKNIAYAIDLLKGNTEKILSLLIDSMQEYANNLDFEKAQSIKEQWHLIKDFQAKSQIISNINYNIDVFSIEKDGDTSFVNYLHVVCGAITRANTFEYQSYLNEEVEDILLYTILEVKERYGELAREIITSIPIQADKQIDNIRFSTPARGDRKKLLDLSCLNVKQYRFDRMKQKENLNISQKTLELMCEIQTSLQLPTLPQKIELFDNSNLAGSDAVSTCVVFQNLKPLKKEYRKYTLSTSNGSDDYGAMKEVLYRRYHKLKEENWPLPSLIIIDGGEGQLGVAHKVVFEQLALNIPIASLVKDSKHQTRELLFYPDQSMGLKPSTPLFKLLSQMQNEVHRFTINFHKDKRSKRQLDSSLNHIKGLGEKGIQKLLLHFGSVTRIKQATPEEIQSILGKQKGLLVYQQIQDLP